MRAMDIYTVFLPHNAFCIRLNCSTSIQVCEWGCGQMLARTHVAYNLHTCLYTCNMDKVNLIPLPDIPACPNQPVDFTFPKTHFWKDHAFLPVFLVQKYYFLHCDEARDLLFCHICVSRFRKRKSKEAMLILPL